MITAVTIENFKGIRERVRLRLKPLTLLFGPNSGGKSTILKAVHYAREVIVKRDPSPYLSSSGLDLGGFTQFVHNRDVRLPVTLRFEMEISEAMELGSCWEPLQSMVVSGEIFDEAVVAATDAISSAWVELTVCWDEPRNRAYVAAYKVGLNGVDIAEIHSKRGRKRDQFDTQLVNLNWEHPFFHPEGESLRDAAWQEHPAAGSASRDSFGINPHRDALPYLHEPLRFARPVGRPLELLLTAALVSPLSYLHFLLNDAVYLGPLRDPIPRDYKQPRDGPDRDRWPDGLAAWGSLFGATDEKLGQISRWLSDPQRLGTGYSIEFRDLDTRDRTTRELVERRRQVLFRPDGGAVALHAAELGTGITQVLPVVVAALGDQWLTTIEQPELHLHPSTQCALGDLLIHGAAAHRLLLVETHSEHLILRVLRRIRETTRGAAPEGFTITPEDLSVVYVSREDGQSVPQTIGVDEHGEFTRDWPDEFFESDFYERFA